MEKKNRILKLFLLPFLLIFGLKTFAQEKDYEIAYKQAIEYFNNKKPKEGFEYLNKAIGINPSFYDALYARAYYLMETEEYEKALNDYNVLVALYPNTPTLHLYRGQAKLVLERYEDAEDDYLTAYELDTADIDITNALGSLYFLMDLHDDALLYLNKSISLDTKNTYALYYKAYNLYMIGRYEESLQDINQVLLIDTQDVDAQRLKAIILIALKKYKEAIALYENLQKKDIQFEVEDFYYWGLAYYEQKKYADAEFYFELPERPENADIYYYLGKTKYQLNNSKEALKKLDSAIVLYGKEDEISAKVFYDRAIVKYRLRDFKGAENDFFYAVYLMPEIINQKDAENKTIPNLLGNAYEMLKMDSKKNVLDSITIRGYQERAEVLISYGDTNKAYTEIQKAIQKDSLNSYSYTIRATTLAMLAKYNSALQDLEKAEKLPKQHLPERIHYIRGLVYLEMGALSDAKTQIEKAHQLNPKQASYKSDLASIEYEIGNLELAIKLINQAIELSPEKLEYWNDRAFYYNSNKQFDKAIEDCNQIIKNDQENIVAYYNRGIAYNALKKYSLAIEDFSRVLDSFPDEPEVVKLRREAIQKLEAEKIKKD